MTKGTVTLPVVAIAVDGLIASRGRGVPASASCLSAHTRQPGSVGPAAGGCGQRAFRRGVRAVGPASAGGGAPA